MDAVADALGVPIRCKYKVAMSTTVLSLPRTKEMHHKGRSVLAGLATGYCISVEN